MHYTPMQLAQGQRITSYHPQATPTKMTSQPAYIDSEGNWQLRHAPSQLAPYSTTQVHSSYVQSPSNVMPHDHILSSPTINTRTRIAEPITRYAPGGSEFLTTNYASVQHHVKDAYPTYYAHSSAPQPLRHLGPSVSSGQPRVIMHPQQTTMRTVESNYGSNQMITRPLTTHHVASQHGAHAHSAQSVIQGRLRPLAAPMEGGQAAPGVEYIVAPASARDGPIPYKRPLTVQQMTESTQGIINAPQTYTPSPPPMPESDLVQMKEHLPDPVDSNTPYADDDKGVLTNMDHCTPIAVGRKLPPAHIDLHGVCVNLQDFFEDRCGIIFGLVGAFCPVDTDRAVPEILKCMENFERLVDFVGCLVVNDPFVVKAWAKKLGVTDQFTFIADSDAKFTKVLGMCQYLPNEGLGVRSRRFALIVGPRAKVRWVGFEEDSFADNVLATLPRFVRTPWKSFLAGIGYSKSESTDQEAMKEEARIKEDTVHTIQSMRALLKNQGFCAEQDWQLVLCDKMSQVFTPTKDNILNGLRWLVEGAQAGDVLCFYFAGKGGRYVNDDGTECVGILPMDYETVGPIGEWEIYDILAPHVPECCRLTIILDINNEHSVTCPLPYVYNSEVSMVPSGFMETQIIKGTNKQWLQQFGSSEKLAGELVVITLVGNAEVPHGCLASLLNTVCAPLAEDKRAEGEGPSPSAEPPLSFADQIDRMQIQLVEWGAEKSVQISTSRPLNLMEEFSLSDVLP